MSVLFATTKAFGAGVRPSREEMQRGSVQREDLPMSTTITIPTELEKKIAGRAASQGKDVEEFALETLSRAVDTPSLRELFADVREQARASDLSDEDLDVRIEAAMKEVRKQRRVFVFTLLLIAGASCRHVMPERYASYDGGRVHVDLPRDTKNSDRDPYVDKETSVVISLHGNGQIYLGKDRSPILKEELGGKLKQLLQNKAESERLIYLAASENSEYGDLVSVLDKIRLQDVSQVGLLVSRARSDGPSRFAVEVPNPPDPNEDLSMMKPNPLMLVVTTTPDLKVRLNTEDFGSVNDPEPLGAKLHDIFQQRTEMRAYRPGVETRTDLPESDRIEKTIIIKANRSTRYGDVIKIIDTVKGAGAAPIVLQIDDLAP